MTITPDDEMSSDAALRARQLLAAKETDSLLTIKDRRVTPTNGGALSPPRRTAGQVTVRVESMGESSSRVKEILSTIKEKREHFSTQVHGTTTPNQSSHDDSSPGAAPASCGKPPRFSTSSEREELTKKMSQSLKEKRDRITRLLSVDHQKQRVMSRSPHTVDTAATEDTTEDSQSTGSWSTENVVPQQVRDDHSKPVAALQEIEEVFESEEGSIAQDNEGNPCTSQDEPPNRPQTDDGGGHFMPIYSNELANENCGSTNTPDSDEAGRNASVDGSDESSQLRTPPHSGDKKVSFGDTLFVIDEMTPPAVVHCTSFDSAFSRERSQSGCVPDDLSVSIGAAESPIRGTPRRRTSSWDASDVDESDARRMRYKSLVNDREKRVTLMRKLEQTYSELVNLHQELEYSRQQQRNSSDEDSDSSYGIFDEESSCEFTDDSNTSGWVSQDESNSKLDSLLQYMTSEDDESFAESYTSQGRFSLTLSQTASNLDTLVEADETEDLEENESASGECSFTEGNGDWEEIVHDTSKSLTSLHSKPIELSKSLLSQSSVENAGDKQQAEPGQASGSDSKIEALSSTPEGPPEASGELPKRVSSEETTASAETTSTSESNTLRLPEPMNEIPDAVISSEITPTEESVPEQKLSGSVTGAEKSQSLTSGNILSIE